MDKIINFFKNRFAKFNVHNYIILGVTFVILVLGLQFSIGMSISLGKGLTLFGDEAYRENNIEISGPTSNDIRILLIFWILTILVLAFFIYYTFFYKLPEKEAKPKDIVDRKVVFVDEKEAEEQKDKNE